MTKIPRRPRGRPVDLVGIETDQLVIDLAAAFAEVFGLGSQRARDLARAYIEGTQSPETPKKMPRGSRRRAAPGSILVAYDVPLPFKAYEQRIARRLKRGEIKSQPIVVKTLITRLRAILLYEHFASVTKKPHF